MSTLNSVLAVCAFSSAPLEVPWPSLRCNSLDSLRKDMLPEFNPQEYQGLMQFPSGLSSLNNLILPSQTAPAPSFKPKHRASASRRQWSAHRFTCNHKELRRAAGGEASAFLVFRFLHPPWREKLCPPGSPARSAWENALCMLQGCRFAAGGGRCGRPLPRCSEWIAGVRIDLYALFHEVCRLAGA